MERNWEAVSGWLGELLADRGVDPISAEELTVPPGMDELFSLLQIKRHHESGEFDVIVVDCAPTGETLRLLSFPDVCTWWLEKVFPLQGRMVAAARPLARTLMPDLPLPGDAVFDDVERLARNLVAMNGILRDRAQHHRPAGDEPRPDGGQGGDADLHLPEPLRLPDRRGGGQPRLPRGGWARATSPAGATRQQEHMELVRSGFSPVPILTAPYFPQRGRRAPRCSTVLGDEVFAGPRRPGRAALRSSPRSCRADERARDAAAGRCPSPNAATSG